MRRYFQLFLIALLAGCASTPPGPSASEAEAPRHGEIDGRLGAIHYVGSLTPEANEEFLASFDSAAVQPRLLLIDSPGGDVGAAMDLGEWMLEHRMDVEVSDVCLSSCANYVFLAGRAKRLRRHSVLMWHGSTWQEGFDRIADPDHPDFVPAFRRTRERERGFFARIGVDNVITMCGHVRGLGIRRVLGAVLRRRQWLGWDYSLGDLVRLGVRGIQLVDGEWNWRDHRSVPSGSIWRVDLGGRYEFSSGRFRTPADRDGAC